MSKISKIVDDIYSCGTLKIIGITKWIFQFLQLRTRTYMFALKAPKAEVLSVDGRSKIVGLGRDWTACRLKVDG